MDCTLPGSSVHGDSPGKNTEVGCLAFLQGIFLTQGLNLHLFHLPALTGSSVGGAGGSLPLAPPEKPYIVYTLSYLQHPFSD